MREASTLYKINISSMGGSVVQKELMVLKSQQSPFIKDFPNDEGKILILTCTSF